MTVATLNTCHEHSFMILILKSGRLNAATQNGSTNNFTVKFFEYLTEYMAVKFLYFWLFSFGPKKLHVDPKIIVLEMG